MKSGEFFHGVGEIGTKNCFRGEGEGGRSQKIFCLGGGRKGDYG